MLSDSFKNGLRCRRGQERGDILVFPFCSSRASSQEGGREGWEGGGSLHASSGEGKYFPLLYVCMVEIHCKKSKYVKG